jgi:hypothetical protein
MHVNSWTSAIIRLDPATGAASETIPLDLAAQTSITGGRPMAR